MAYTAIEIITITGDEIAVDEPCVLHWLVDGGHADARSVVIYDDHSAGTSHPKLGYKVAAAGDRNLSFSPFCPFERGIYIVQTSSNATITLCIQRWRAEG